MVEPIATHVFRMAQELAVNAAKHGHGKWVSIRITPLLGATPPAARLEVDNDGVSFDGEMAVGDGMGLHLVKQRAEVLGAAVTFSPREPNGGGTHVVCEFPLAPSAHSC